MVGGGQACRKTDGFLTTLIQRGVVIGKTQVSPLVVTGAQVQECVVCSGDASLDSF